MNDQTPVLQLSPTTFPTLPKLSELTRTFWNELLGLGGIHGNGIGEQPSDIGGKPWQ